MQDAARIQDQIDYQTEHQKAAAALALEQLAGVQRNKAMAEQELAKFRVLREGFNVASGVMNQQLAQIKAQEAPNPVSITAFEGALVHLEGLMKQADIAIAKNEGSHMAFSTMVQQYEKQMVDAQARQRVLATQGGNAVELASRAPGESVVEAVEVGEDTVAVGAIPDTTAPELDSSLDALVEAAAAVGEEEPAPKPIAAPKKKPSSKKGGGRKQKKR